jgi:hypothetical protein
MPNDTYDVGTDPPEPLGYDPFDLDHHHHHHAHMAQSSESPLHRSASSHRPSGFCIRFSVKLSDLVLSPIDSFFPSFRIHGIVVIHHLHRRHRLQRLQSSPESPCAPCAYGGCTHAHMSTPCEYDGVNGVNISFFVDFCFGLFFFLPVHQFSPHPDVSFLRLPSLMYAIFRESSSLSLQRMALSEQSPRVRIK